MISTATSIWLLLIVLVLGVACLALRKKLLTIRARNLERLTEQRERLQGIISELLSRIDDIDASCKYRQLKLDPHTSHRIENTCSKLVSLSDSLKDIEQQLEAKQDKQAGRTLVESLESAQELSSEIQSLRQEVTLLQEER